MDNSGLLILLLMSITTYTAAQNSLLGNRGVDILAAYARSITSETESPPSRTTPPVVSSALPTSRYHVFQSGGSVVSTRKPYIPSDRLPVFKKNSILQSVSSTSTVASKVAEEDYPYSDYYYYDDYVYADDPDSNPKSTFLGPVDPPSTASPNTIPKLRYSTTKRPLESESGTTFVSLSDLIAQLKVNVVKDYFDNASESPNRIARVLPHADSTTPIDTTTMTSKVPVDMQVSISNTTESTVVVASVQASHSVSINKDNSLPFTTLPLGPEISTTTTRTIPQATENAQSNNISKNKDVSHFSVRPTFEQSTISDSIQTSPRVPVGPSTTISQLNLLNNIVIDDVSALVPEDYNNTVTSSDGQGQSSSLLSLFPAIKASTERTSDQTTIRASSEHTTSKTLGSTASLPSNIKIETVDNSAFLPPGFNDNVTIVDNADFLPPGFKSKVETVDPSAFLPPGFNPEIVTIDPSSFLPPGFKSKVETVDPSSFLPPGFKPEVVTIDPSSFLPPGFELGTTKDETKYNIRTTTKAPTTTSTSAPRHAVNFPTRNDKPGYRTTTPKNRRKGTTQAPPPTVTYENLLARFKTATPRTIRKNVTPRLGLYQTTNAPKVVVKTPKATTESPTTSTTSTTTTTTTTTPTTTTKPPRPTTPGVCGERCRLSGTVKLVGGVKWRPELENRDTLEFRNLSNSIKTELEAMFRKTPLSPWFVQVHIDSFNPGSVIVYYFLQLTGVSAQMDTLDIKQYVNNQVMQDGLGQYTIDPEATEFVVTKEKLVSSENKNAGFVLPDWLLAVIIIGSVCFLFIVIFACTMVYNRAKVKKRRDITLTEEYLNKLNAASLHGSNDYHYMHGEAPTMDVWDPSMYARAHKPPSSKGRGYNPTHDINIYDSWNISGWTGHYGSSTYSKRRPDTNF